MVWIDRNQLGRRNLTDEQRAVVIGRLYKTFKRDPRWNLKQLRRPWDWGWDWEDVEIRQLKLSCRKGGNVTAEIIAKQVGVGQATVRRAEKFTEAVEALVSLKAGSIARQITERLPSQRFTDAPLGVCDPALAAHFLHAE